MTRSGSGRDIFVNHRLLSRLLSSGDDYGTVRSCPSSGSEANDVGAGGWRALIGCNFSTAKTGRAQMRIETAAVSVFRLSCRKNSFLSIEKSFSAGYIISTSGKSFRFKITEWCRTENRWAGAKANRPHGLLDSFWWGLTTVQEIPEFPDNIRGEVGYNGC